MERSRFYAVAVSLFGYAHIVFVVEHSLKVMLCSKWLNNKQGI